MKTPTFPRGLEEATDGFRYASLCRASMFPAVNRPGLRLRFLSTGSYVFKNWSRTRSNPRTKPESTNSESGITGSRSKEILCGVTLMPRSFRPFSAFFAASSEPRISDSRKSLIQSRRFRIAARNRDSIILSSGWWAVNVAGHEALMVYAVSGMSFLMSQRLIQRAIRRACGERTVRFATLGRSARNGTFSSSAICLPSLSFRRLNSSSSSALKSSSTRGLTTLMSRMTSPY